MIRLLAGTSKDFRLGRMSKKAAGRCAETDGSSWRAWSFLVPSILVLGYAEGMFAHCDACSPVSVQISWIVNCVRLLMIALEHW